jgi:hypothetical protein
MIVEPAPQAMFPNPFPIVVKQHRAQLPKPVDILAYWSQMKLLYPPEMVEPHPLKIHPLLPLRIMESSEQQTIFRLPTRIAEQFEQKT